MICNVKITMTEVQKEALFEMKPFEWYSPYELRASFEILASLHDAGWLFKLTTFDGPVSFVMFSYRPQERN